MTNYLQLAQDIVNKVAAQDVEAEVFIEDNQELMIRVEKGEIEQLSQSGSRGMGVRVIDGGRVGYAYTSDFSDAGIEETWQAAVELATVATPDEFRALPEPMTIPDDDLEIYDPDLAAIPTAQKVEFLKAVERAALDYDARVAMTDRATYQDSITHIYLANSKGFAGTYDRTTASSYVIGIGRDEEGKMTEAYGLKASNFFSDLDAQAIGQEAGRMAVELLGGEPVETQVGTVILHPFVAAEILGAIAGALTGEAMQKGRSFLMGKVGQEVGSDKVTLLDNGRMKRGLASAPFDGEGVPTSANRLIDEGVLQSVIHDSYTARKDQVGSTGNAQRGYRSTPSLGPSNFYIQPGHVSPEAMIAGVEKGLYVTSIMQTGGINAINGDCSMGASGMWIENGKLTRPVGNVTIATTLPELLQNVSEVGDDLRVVPFGGVIGTPHLRIDNVTIGGVDGDSE